MFESVDFEEFLLQKKSKYFYWTVFGLPLLPELNTEAYEYVLLLHWHV